jgi:hypothetical protein
MRNMPLFLARLMLTPPIAIFTALLLCAWIVYMWPYKLWCFTTGTENVFNDKSPFEPIMSLWGFAKPEQVTEADHDFKN